MEYPPLHLEGHAGPVVLILKHYHTLTISLRTMGSIKWIMPCGRFPHPGVVMMSKFCGRHFISGVRFIFLGGMIPFHVL